VTTRRPRAAGAAAWAVLALEVIGSLLMWAPIPVAWVWVGARVYDVSDSFVAGASVWFAGFLATLWLVAAALTRLDCAWVELRRRAGHERAGGALTNVVVVSATIALAAFFLWFYVIGKAFVIPFMPSGRG
jgi:hypothetical protein